MIGSVIIQITEGNQVENHVTDFIKFNLFRLKPATSKGNSIAPINIKIGTILSSPLFLSIIPAIQNKIGAIIQ